MSIQTFNPARYSLNNYSAVNTYKLFLDQSNTSSLREKMTFIDLGVKGNRLKQNGKGEILLIPKTLPEVIGEKTLFPLANLCSEIGKKILSSLSYFPNSPTLLPVVSAQTVYKTSKYDPSKNDVFRKFFGSDRPKTQTEEKPLKKDCLSILENNPDVLFEQIFDSPELYDLTRIVFIRDSKGLNLLQAAIERAPTKVIKVLVETFRGTDFLHEIDSEGRNLLHLAAIEGRAESIPVFSGIISTMEKDNKGFTPLHHAINRKQSPARCARVSQKLIENGASISDPYIKSDGTVYAPLWMTVDRGNIKLLDILLENDFFEEVDLAGGIPEVGTVLHAAIISNQIPMLKHLLGITPPYLVKLKDYEGRTPLQLATLLKREEAVQLLSKGT